MTMTNSLLSSASKTYLLSRFILHSTTTRLLLGLMLLTLVRVSGQPRSHGFCVAERGIEYDGTGFGKPIPYDIDGCESYCLATEDCEGFIITDGLCEMQKSIDSETRRENNHTIAGLCIREKPKGFCLLDSGVDYLGHDLGSSIPDSNVNLCEKSCLSDDECVGFVVDPKFVCRLKSKLDADMRIEKAKFMAGICVGEKHPTPPATDLSPPSSLSRGIVGVIVVVVVFTVYCIVGVVFNKFHRGAVGSEIIPNREFWFGCLSLLARPCRPGPGSAYDADDPAATASTERLMGAARRGPDVAAAAAPTKETGRARYSGAGEKTGTPI